MDREAIHEALYDLAVDRRAILAAVELTPGLIVLDIDRAADTLAELLKRQPAVWRNC